MREAMAWVESWLDLSLEYIPADRQDGFLAEVDARLGTGGSTP
jgi:hypothetical protein